MKKPYYKIKVLVVCSAISIALTIFVSAICALILDLLHTKTVFSILTFFATMIVLNIFNYFLFKALINRENKKHKKYLVLKLKSGEITDILNKPSIIKIDDNIYAFIFDKYMFDTITLYFLDESFNEQNIAALRNIARQYFKQHYKSARETNSRKKHHELKVQLYIVNQKTEIFNAALVYKGGEQLFSIGFIRVLLNLDEQEMILPFYTGKEMEISSLRNYDKAVGLLCQLFEIEKMSERD